MNDMNLTGKWFNPRTGEEINVRSNVIDGEDMIIITDKGNISMQEFSEFIQMGDEQISNTSLPQEVSMSAEVRKELESAKKDTQEAMMIDVVPVSNNNNVKKQTKKESKQVDVINTFFNKITSKPEITIILGWNDFPWDQLKTLIEFLDIKEEDISNYILDHYINSESIQIELNKILKKLNIVFLFE